MVEKFCKELRDILVQASWPSILLPLIAALMVLVAIVVIAIVTD
jgi:hypothetical protein